MNRYMISFFIFSFLGWLWESVYCTVNQKKWANRGFLYGPVCPIYGFGGSFGLLIYDFIRAGRLLNLEWWMIFIMGFMISMILEYLTSWILEKLFQARWWDYSHLPFNIEGRTSAPTSIAFGMAAIFIMKVIIPFVDSKLVLLSQNAKDILTILLVALISIDTTLTVTALTDFQEKILAVDENFQRHMTDMVERFYESQNYFHQKALDRIVLFKFSGRRYRIAKKLVERRLRDLFKER